MCNVVGVRYREGCKIYDFDAGEYKLVKGDTVIVDSEQGVGAAFVATDVHAQERGPDSRPLKKVVRKASEEDLARLEKNGVIEDEAFRACQAKIKERDMIMKLVRVEWAFDNSKATFYFTADGRVDFRDLVKDLAHRFRIRIEMRQIGVRDEAKMIGGYGPCGRSLCCSSFLRDFEPVSIKMAKKQDLVLNPAKISGICGRLMCCLGYEYSFYDEAKRDIKRKEKEKELAAAAAAQAAIDNPPPPAAPEAPPARPQRGARPVGKPQQDRPARPSGPGNRPAAGKSSDRPPKGPNRPERPSAGRPQQDRPQENAADRPQGGTPDRTQNRPPNKPQGRPLERVPGKVIQPSEESDLVLTDTDKQEHEKQKRKRNAWRKKRKKPGEGGEPGGSGGSGGGGDKKPEA